MSCDFFASLKHAFPSFHFISAACESAICERCNELSKDDVDDDNESASDYKNASSGEAHKKL